MPLFLGRSRWLARAGWLIAFYAIPAAAQVSEAVQDIARLVVVVKSRLPGQGTETAGGIVFGASGNRLYIVTTNHTVRRGADVVADRIEVTGRWQSQPFQGRLLNSVDSALDIAVLSVDTPQPGSLRFDVTGSPGALGPGDPLVIIGHTEEKNWVLKLQTKAFTGLDGIRLYFQSVFEDRILSGAAVLNNRTELVGMLRNGEPPRMDALDIDMLMRWLSGNGYPVALRPVGAASKLSELEDSIEADVATACGSLSAFGMREISAEEQKGIAKLALFRQKVEADPRLYGGRSFILGMLYRCLAATYLIDGKLEVAEKLKQVIPALSHSLEYYPDQPLLARNLAYFKSILGTGDITVDPRVFATNSFQVVQGRDSPELARLVQQMTNYIGDAEFQAQQWIMNEATNPTFMSMMEAAQMMGKKQANQDWTIDVTSKKLPNGLVEVKATIGPNVFVWNVDYRRKRFTAENELTQRIAAMVAKSKK